MDDVRIWGHLYESHETTYGTCMVGSGSMPDLIGPAAILLC